MHPLSLLEKKFTSVHDKEHKKLFRYFNKIKAILCKYITTKAPYPKMILDVVRSPN
jgi:hypothetical protein